jgi:biopolymer transport protein ExbB
MSLPVSDAVQTAAASSGVAVSFDLISMWRSMGFMARSVAVVLAAMSIYSLAVMAERLLVYARAVRASRRFVRELGGLLPTEKFAEAVELSKARQRSYLARVMGAALIEYQQGAAHAVAKGATVATGYDVLGAVSRSFERQSVRVAAELRRGLGGLATISSAAPFVGLLGTVGGIITAFQSMAATGSGGLGSVSAGIAESLVTTAFGLFVAIPAVMMFNYFTHRVEAIEVDIATCMSELVDFLTKREQRASYAGSKAVSVNPSWGEREIFAAPKTDGPSSLPE